MQADTVSMYSKALRKQLADAGLQGALQTDAFKLLLEYMTNEQADPQIMAMILEQLKQAMEDDGMVSAGRVQAALRQQAGSTREPEHVVVVDAFTVPRVRYDSIHKRLVDDSSSQQTLQPTAEAKIKMYQGRFSLLYQRLRRNSRFAPLNAVQATLPNQMHAQLTELNGLKGIVGQRCIVMGLICSQEDGTFALEDEAGTVPIDLTGARAAAGLVTENCVVVAEGVMGLDGVFRVSVLAFPSCETRAQLPATAQKLNFFGGPPLTTEVEVRLELEQTDHEEDRIVFLANVWLDRSETFEALHTLLSGFQDAEMIPAMIVMMGNFSAAATSNAADADYVGLREGFTQLARLIDTYSTIKANSRFVFVPGPNDPGLGHLLPQPALPTYFTSELQAVLPNAVFSTNPCRIRYFTREIVVFRYDLLKQMRRRCLVPPAVDDDVPELLFNELALTVLQQSTLCPLPQAVQPVHWAHEQALHVYPLPHAVVLADASAPQSSSSFIHEGCRVMNPGCLPDKLFSAFKPIPREDAEEDGVDDDPFEPSELPSGATQDEGQADAAA